MAGMAAGIESCFDDECIVVGPGRGGSGKPILFDNVPELLDGVGRLYGDAPNGLPPFKRELFVRYPVLAW